IRVDKVCSQFVLACWRSDTNRQLRYHPQVVPIEMVLPACEFNEKPDGVTKTAATQFELE
ncbi:MAG: hypothetical protein U0930_17640, partial [Pirellulales bacterium]